MGRAKHVFHRIASKSSINKSVQEFTAIGAEPKTESKKEVHQDIKFCKRQKDTLVGDIYSLGGLPYFQASLLACIVEDAVSQLRILDECNNELRIIKTMADMANLRAKKYQIAQEHLMDDLSSINPRNLHCMQYKLDKLAADRIYCTQVMLRTYVELAVKGSYTTLSNNNKAVEENELNRICLIEDENKNKMSRRELMKQLRQQRNHMKTVTYDNDVIIDQLKSQVEDAALNAETRSRYIENWQRARTEQHIQTITDKEAGPSNAIQVHRYRMDQEQRIHAEVELLVNIFINETLTKVDSWMSKYDTDMENIDLKIQIMKNKYQDAVHRKLDMEETYARHEELMKNWIQFKEDREKARQYVDKMTKSAVIVQAWWRGLLVRLELGPFKPQKRKPTLGKDAKKK